MTRRFLHGPGADEPMLEDSNAALDCSGTRVLHPDRQGSIIAQADCWGGRQAINAYDEYGNPQGGAISGRFGYTGQAWLPELKLYYYKARLYDPANGKFMQTDPIGYDDQYNLYAYVGADPVNATDPDGTDGACLYTSGGCWGTSDDDPKQAERELRAGTGMAVAAGVAVSEAAGSVVLGAVVRGAGALGKLLGLGGKGLNKAEQLAANRAAGKAGEAATRARLGNKVAAEQVTFKTSTGQRARADFVTKSKDVVESKSGGARLSSGQRQLKDDIDNGRPVIPVGENAAKAGLSPGVPTKMRECVIDRLC